MCSGWTTVLHERTSLYPPQSPEEFKNVCISYWRTEFLIIFNSFRQIICSAQINDGLLDFIVHMADPEDNRHLQLFRDLHKNGAHILN